MANVFNAIQSGISESGGWFFILSVNAFLVFVLYIAFSKYGKIRLGGVKAKPEFSKGAWFAMLFSAGMGIGILFWSVGEPINHFFNSPTVEPGTVEAAGVAMEYTFLHWGAACLGHLCTGWNVAGFFHFQQGAALNH